MTDKQAWKTYFASIKTDSKGVEDPKDPNDTLMTLYRLLAPATAAEFEPVYVKGGVGYGELKKRLQDAYNETFGPLAKNDAQSQPTKRSSKASSSKEQTAPAPWHAK